MHDELNQNLESLRGELASSPLLPDASRQALEALARDLELAIAQGGGDPAKAVVEQLETLLIAYEEEHPLVARVIDNLLTTLVNIGI